ncbi:MAG: ABC transporter ATP-binding protein [Bacillota bacterium]
MLELKNVHTFYGVVEALRGISLTVNEGEIVTLIGANGAGKTTTLKTITSSVKAASGEIYFAGKRIDKLPEDEIVKLGISLVPEGRRVFPRMTVLENLEMGAYVRRFDRAGILADLKKMYALFPRLEERKSQRAETLSGGEQQMLAIARALMSRPRLLMLDEPSMGLAPLIVKGIFDIIREINDAGTTVLLVEQNARMALKAANRGYVIRTGEIVKEGDAKSLAADPAIRAAYLGEKVYVKAE